MSNTENVGVDLHEDLPQIRADHMRDAGMHSHSVQLRRFEAFVRIEQNDSRVEVGRSIQSAALIWKRAFEFDFIC